MVCHVCVLWVEIFSFSWINPFDDETPSQYYLSVDTMYQRTCPCVRIHTHTQLWGLSRYRIMPLHKWPIPIRQAMLLSPIPRGGNWGLGLCIAVGNRAEVPIRGHTLIHHSPFCLLILSEQRPGGHTSSATFWMHNPKTTRRTKKAGAFTSNRGVVEAEVGG